MKKLLFFIFIIININAFSQDRNKLIYFTDSIHKELFKKERLNYYFNTYVNPDDYNGVLNKAFTLYKNGLYNEAIDNYRISLQLLNDAKASDTKFTLFKNDNSHEIYFYIGLCKHKLNQLDSAIFYCKKALSIKEKYEEVVNEISSILIEQNQLYKAKIYANKSININKNSGIGYYLLAYINYLTGYKSDVTILYMKKSIEVNPNYDKPSVILSNFYYDKRKYDKALIYADLAIKCKTNNLSVYFIKSAVKLNKYDLISAYKTLEDAMLINPNNEDLLLNIGQLSFLYDKPKIGIKYLSTVYKNNIANKKYDKKEFDYIKEEFETLIIKLDNDSLMDETKQTGYTIFTNLIKGNKIYTQYNLQLNEEIRANSNIYFKEKYPNDYEFINGIYLYLAVYTGALISHANITSLFEEVLEYNQNITNLNVYYAKLLVENNRYEKALKYINRAIYTYPEKIYFYNLKGHILYKMGLSQKAEIEFLKALNKDKNNSNSYIGLGLIYYSDKEYLKAKEYYLKALKINSNSTTALNNLGLYYYNTQQYDSSIYMYNKALEIDKDFMYARVNRSNAYIAKGFIMEARGGYNKAVRKYPNNKYFNIKLGDYFFLNNDYIDALRQYNKVIEIDENYAEAYIKKGNCFLEIENYNKSIFTYKKALSLDSTMEEINARIARFYYIKGYFDKFLKYNQLELEMHPENETGLINLAAYKLQNGEIKEARDLYVKIHSMPRYNKKMIVKDLKRIMKEKTYKKEAKEIYNNFFL